ncbi:MAG: Fic family protein [Dehalococcoidia bacterium]|jgi:Fic family protein|nr:Fic family protein [Dehalococcoidia bacterium]
MRLRLSYELSDECKDDLNAIDAERYAVRALIPGGLEEYFARQARIFSTRGSTAIEGNDVAGGQAASIVEGTLAPSDQQELEVYNLAQAYDLAYQLTDDRSMVIDGGTIRSLNSVLQKGATEPGAASRGTYRRPGGPDVTIRADRGRGAVLYQPPRADDVGQLMAGFVEDVQRWREQEPGPVAAALTHFAFVSIHPFENGNGRTARLLADMVLDLTGWSVERMLSVSSAIHASGDEYFDALRATQGRAFVESVDASPFVEYHTRRLRRAVDQLQQSVVWLVRTAEEISDERDTDQAVVLLSWYLLNLGPITSSAYAKLIGTSQSTAVEKLRGQVEIGFLTRIGAGRSTRYTLTSGVSERVARRVAEEPALYVA